MLINKKAILPFKPCKDRFDNYLNSYPNASHTPAQFMGLRKISHSDKVWVGVRLVPKEKVRFLAADIAELVLPIWEAKYPDDLRPRLAIEAARNVNATPEELKVAANAAYDAYSAAADAAFHAAADAAADAAYFAARAAADAVAAAADAVAADAAYNANAAVNAANAAYNAYAVANDAANAAVNAVNAANAAANNSNNKAKIEKKIRTLIIKYLK